MAKGKSKQSKIDHKILCVDDEEIILRALQRLFNYVGYQTILTTYSGETALGILENNLDTAVIIADEKMGADNMSGNEFLKRSMELCPNAVRIQLTAFSDPEILQEAVNEAKVYSHIHKPWDNKELVKTVQAGLKEKLLKEAEHQRLLQMTKAARHYKKENADLKQDIERLENTNEQLQRAMAQTAGQVTDGFMNTLLFVMQYAAPDLWFHSRRVGKWCLLMAQELDDAERYPATLLQIAGVLHDIGKLNLPKELQKIDVPLDQLTEDQQNQLSGHVVDGLWLIRRLPEEVRKALRSPIREHHERYDGNGPYRKFQDQIDNWAQIIAIASDYDHFRFDISHGGPRGQQEAIEKMEEDLYSAANSAGKYDGKPGGVFEIFEQLTKEVSDQDLDRQSAEEVDSIDEVEIGQVLAEDIYTVKDTFFLARGHTIEASDIQKMRLYEEENNDVRNLWIEVKESDS